MTFTRYLAVVGRTAEPSHCDGMRANAVIADIATVRGQSKSLRITPMDYEALGALQFNTEAVLQHAETMHVALQRLADQHYMMPGSHESRDGAHCRCGANKCAVWLELSEMGF